MSYQLQALQADFAGKILNSNQRASFRYKCAPATTGKIFSGNREEFQRGWVLDLSKTGAGVLLNRPLPQDQTVYLQVTSPSNNQKYEFLVRIIHSTQKLRSGEWIVGVQFECPLTDDELEILL